MKSNSGRLISETNDAPIDLDGVAESATMVRREESDDEDAAVALAAIPAIEAAASGDGARRPKRARSDAETDMGADADADADQNNQFETISDDGDPRDGDDDLFVQSPIGAPPAKRQRPVPAAAEDEDDKKKLAMDISYEGFSIYGRVLCLVVKRRDGSGADPTERGGNASASAGGNGSNRAKAGAGSRGQAMMENFIISTQVPAGADVP